MQWPLIIGSAALSVWLISTIIRIFDRQFEILEHAENGQLRLLYGLLRLMETSPPGLISTALKLQLCRYISLAFSELQQKHGANAGYQACVDTAEAQIDLLKGRAIQAHLPHFDDPERIAEGQKALPRFHRIVGQLQELNILDADEAKRFRQELDDRRFELEADTCILRANRAENLGDLLTAQRHYQSARLSLQQLQLGQSRAARLEHLQQRLLNLQNKV